MYPCTVVVNSITSNNYNYNRCLHQLPRRPSYFIFKNKNTLRRWCGEQSGVFDTPYYKRVETIIYYTQTHNTNRRQSFHYRLVMYTCFVSIVITPTIKCNLNVILGAHSRIAIMMSNRENNNIYFTCIICIFTLLLPSAYFRTSVRHLRAYFNLRSHKSKMYRYTCHTEMSTIL